MTSWVAASGFTIKGRGEGPVDGIDFRGVAAAGATPEVPRRDRDPEGRRDRPIEPGDPIRPILDNSRRPRALVESEGPGGRGQPLVAGQVLKGPTAAFMEWAGQPLSAGRNRGDL